jgi:hypothetical protein
MCINVINRFDVLEEEPKENNEYLVETPFRKPFHAIYTIDGAFPCWKTETGDDMMVMEGQRFMSKDSYAFNEIRVKTRNVGL